MEIVISLGILAVVIPLVLALTAAGGRASREAGDDTRSAFIARSVAHEIMEARAGRGQLIEEALSWPRFPSAGERIVFAADREGNLLRRLEPGVYESGIREDEVAYLVSVRGEEQLFEAHPGLATLSKVEISLEFPAVAGRENRRRRTFVQLMSPDES